LSNNKEFLFKQNTLPEKMSFESSKKVIVYMLWGLKIL